jgi:carbonic anhydrase
MPGLDENDRTLARLLDNNRAWAERINKEHPGFFEKLARQQAPEVLWIGCSDSRVPANEIIGVMPGEVFVHRNVANQVMHVDFNCLAVMQYAVEALRVRHIIVCGHYGCGGVRAALKRHELGLLDNWLYGIGALREKHQAKIDAAGAAASIDLLCEINVIEQVRNVCNTSILQQAWRRGQDIAVHGWIYGIHDGRLNDLAVTIGAAAETDPTIAAALEAAAARRRVTPPNS